MVVRIFGIEPHLDGVARSAWRLSLQAPAPRDVNLQLDQIEPRRTFGHGMFDLQPRVHLHKGKTLAFRFVQELHGAGVVVSRRLAQTHRRLAQRLILFRRKRRRGRFLKNLLVAALDGAIAHAQRPTLSRSGRR